MSADGCVFNTTALSLAQNAKTAFKQTLYCSPSAGTHTEISAWCFARTVHKSFYWSEPSAQYFKWSWCSTVSNCVAAFAMGLPAQGLYTVNQPFIPNQIFVFLLKEAIILTCAEHLFHDKTQQHFSTWQMHREENSPHWFMIHIRSLNRCLIVYSAFFWINFNIVQFKKMF